MDFDLEKCYPEFCPDGFNQGTVLFCKFQNVDETEINEYIQDLQSNDAQWGLIVTIIVESLILVGIILSDLCRKQSQSNRKQQRIKSSRDKPDSCSDASAPTEHLSKAASATIKAETAPSAPTEDKLTATESEQIVKDTQASLLTRSQMKRSFLKHLDKHIEAKRQRVAEKVAGMEKLHSIAKENADKLAEKSRKLQEELEEEEAADNDLNGTKHAEPASQKARELKDAVIYETEKEEKLYEDLDNLKQLIKSEQDELERQLQKRRNVEEENRVADQKEAQEMIRIQEQRIRLAKELPAAVTKSLRNRNSIE